MRGLSIKHRGIVDFERLEYCKVWDLSELCIPNEPAITFKGMEVPHVGPWMRFVAKVIASESSGDGCN